jgi:hypothetical protein
MAGRAKWSQKVKYIVTVLWMHGGSTEREIAASLTASNLSGPMNRDQVKGILNQTGYRSLDRAERQKVLDALKNDRLDGNLIPERCFSAIKRG